MVCERELKQAGEYLPPGTYTHDYCRSRDDLFFSLFAATLALVIGTENYIVVFQPQSVI
jgi:hypothetical protein